MIEIEGETLRTEREWERRHRHVLKSQRDKGVEREWCIKPPNKYAYATWYRKSQTKPVKYLVNDTTKFRPVSAEPPCYGSRSLEAGA